MAHIGAGAGYYAAILAELVGKEGSVTAVEFDARRAQSAKKISRTAPTSKSSQQMGAAGHSSPPTSST